MFRRLWRALVSYFSSPLLVNVGLNPNVDRETGDGYATVEGVDNYGREIRGDVAIFVDNKKRFFHPDKNIVMDIFKQIEKIGYRPISLVVFKRINAKKIRKLVYNNQGKLISR